MTTQPTQASPHTSHAHCPACGWQGELDPLKAQAGFLSTNYQQRTLVYACPQCGGVLPQSTAAPGDRAGNAP